MPRPAAIMSRSLQRPAKCSSHDQRAGSNRGLIANGELRCEQALDPFASPCPARPAAGRGSGRSSPQLPCELPLPIAPRSTRVTCQPARIK